MILLIWPTSAMLLLVPITSSFLSSVWLKTISSIGACSPVKASEELPKTPRLVVTSLRSSGSFGAFLSRPELKHKIPMMTKLRDFSGVKLKKLSAIKLSTAAGQKLRTIEWTISFLKR